MYLHVGGDTVVLTGSILAICDLDNASFSHRTREYLRRAEQEGRVVNVAEDLPKSFAVAEKNGRETVYLSQLNSATLLRRAESGFFDSLSI